MKKKHPDKRAECVYPARQLPKLIPSVDIFETDELVVVHTEMPGIDKKDIVIRLNENVLTISATMESKPEPEETFLLQEFDNVHYTRQFRVADTINDCSIEAVMDNGILTLKLPKKSSRASRRIEIDVK